MQAVSWRSRQVTAGGVHHVLFLCTGNSARSILAESLLNRLGEGRFRAFSAGSHPKGQVHPLALEALERRGLPVVGLRSKSWDEYAAPAAPPIDFIFTVCDSAAAEVCPVWPAKAMSVHWGIADPAAVEGSEATRRQAFRATLQALEVRIRRFVALPIESLDPQKLKSLLQQIGQDAP